MPNFQIIFILNVITKTLNVTNDINPGTLVLIQFNYDYTFEVFIIFS